jgi:uncharacterized protein involved in outer membrane biogenesis
MRGLRGLGLAVGILLLVAGAVTHYWLPQIVRRVAVAQIEATTHRPASIEAVDLSLLRGRISVRGFRLGERDGTTPFADVERLDVRLHLPALLRGHLWIRELLVNGSTVRVVRLTNGDFNFSDLIQASGSTERTFDVTVDRFALERGTVTLEDRALPETRTWSSEHITIEAHNVSTLRGDGTAVGRSVTAGAPLWVEINDLRLYPIHLRAVVKLEGADLTPLRVYIPPDAAVSLVGGRASTSVAVVLDARAGLRGDATVRFDDVVLGPPAGGEALAVAPRLTIDVRGFGVRDDDLEVTRLAAEGTIRVRDPSAPPSARYPLSTVRASVLDLTWPARTAGQLDAAGTIPGGGTLSIVGTVRPPPASTQLAVRVANVDLGTWAQFLPVAAQVSGRAEANLRMNEPLAAGVPARVQGSIAVNRLAVGDAGQEVLGASRIEARGLELHWPARLVVTRLQVNGPRGFIERDGAGSFPIAALVAPSAPAATARVDGGANGGEPALAVEIEEVGVREGRLTWRDKTRSPAAQLIVSAIDATVTNVGWPRRGPLGVQVSARPPGGGLVRLSGRIGVDPVAADLRVAANGAELAPYQPYVPIAALVSGAADLDVSLVVPPLVERRASVRGSAGLSRLDVRDGERTVARIERATATGVEIDWPGRVAVDRLALARPWLLLERDSGGSLALRDLLAPPPAMAGATVESNGTAAGRPLAVTVARLAVDEGGVRVVDRSVSPSFAVDVQPARLRMEGIATQGGTPARLDLSGHVGAAAELTVRGTLAAFGGPLRVDVSGELREFAVPRTNPYLLQQVGWKSAEGRLTTKLQCRIDGDALSAKTEVRVSRLSLLRAGSHDEAQKRVGLPLGLLTTLLKDRRGDISVSFPVGGRLNDPRFDFREAIWTAIRSVAINAVTLPVSWIGRMHFSPDSKIERIQVDPILFEPGTATLTSEGEARASRLVAFLDHLPEVRMSLAPVVSARDVEELRHRALEAALDRATREERLSHPEAVARLYAQQFPGQGLPERPEAALAALLERVSLPTSHVDELGAARLDMVRGVAKRSGIDTARLPDSHVGRREDGGSEVDLEILEPEGPQPSKLRDALRKLGVPLKRPGSTQ